MARSSSRRKLLSGFSIMANSLTAASIFTYPVFSPALQDKLKFSVQQVSATASSAVLLQYLFSPIWGAFADRYGARHVSLSAAILFLVGYSSLGYLLEHPTSTTENYLRASSWIPATAAYSLCGMATAASYFAAITTSAQMFGTSHPGLSIAGPSSLFALSPLAFTFLATHFFDGPDGFDTPGYIKMLAIISFLVNLLGAINFESRVDVSRDLIDERTALLGPPEDDIAQLSRVNEAHHDFGILQFLSKPTVWLFGLSVLLAVGPAEMTLASMGSVVDAYYPDGGVSLKAKHVQLISIMNTVSRILTGYLSDRICGQSWGGRLAFLTSAPLLYGLLCLFFGFRGKALWLLSSFTGLCYGTLFALAPSLVATVWPLRSFGRNYGIISYFAAAGSFMFTMLFGILFEETNDNNNNNNNDQKKKIEIIIKIRESIKRIYMLGFLSESISIFLILVLFKAYWSKKIP